MTFSVLTMNFWNISEPLEVRYRALEAGLKRLRPDIICLQEMDRDPKTRRGQTGLIAEMCGLTHQVEHNGLAIICSNPIVDSSHVELPEFPGDFPRNILLVESTVDNRPLLIANTHLAYPLEFAQERRQQTEVLLPAIERFRSGRIAKVLCGDFNDTPDSAAVRAVLDSDQKFYDVFAECRPNSDGITFSPRSNQYVHPVWTLDQRIDYIFANGDLAAQDCSVVFDGSNGLDLVSDHYGVFGRLVLRVAN
jgi:endonuclease/exonuclease/phosphatase family metal-dependent hydrolase